MRWPSIFSLSCGVIGGAGERLAWCGSSRRARDSSFAFFLCMPSSSRSSHSRCRLIGTTEGGRSSRSRAAASAAASAEVGAGAPLAMPLGAPGSGWCGLNADLDWWCCGNIDRGDGGRVSIMGRISGCGLVCLVYGGICEWLGGGPRLGDGAGTVWPS